MMKTDMLVWSGVKISMWIESKLGAAADGHLQKESGSTTRPRRLLGL